MQLLPDLTIHTNRVVIPALKLLAAATEQRPQLKQPHQLHQQQQQQQSKATDELIAQHFHAASYVHGIIALWMEMLLHLKALLQPFSSVVPSLSAAVHLCTSAAPLMSRGLLKEDFNTANSCDAGSSTWWSTVPAANCKRTPVPCEQSLAQYLQEVVCQAIELSDFMVQRMTPEMVAGNHAAEEQHQQQQQQQGELLQVYKLTELMLFVLANQAAGLRAGVEDSKTASAAPAAAQPQRTATGYQGIMNSHGAVLNTLGFPAAIRVQTNAQKYVKQVCLDAMWVLLCLINQRQEAVTCSSSSSEGTAVVNHVDEQQGNKLPAAACAELSAGGEGQDEHHHLVDKASGVLPMHLPSQAARLVIEIITSQADMCQGNQDDDLPWLAMAVELIVQLSMSTAAAGHSESASHRQEEVPRLAEATAASLRPRGLTKSPWPVLPAAVAAGLLHPVLQLLSRAVIRAMKETELKQQQQEQQQQKQKVTNDAAMKTLRHNSA